MRRKWKCPECGNTDRRKMATNIDRLDSPDLTLLCEARVSAADHCDLWQFKDVTKLPGYNPKDGTAMCGMQWDPNEED